MRYVDHGSGGDASCMRIAEGPQPSPGPGELLVKVEYAGINRPDLLQRAGLYPPPPDASPLLGLEVAGHIAAVGQAVAEWATGMPVTALANGGGYAEYCVVPQEQALRVPKGMSLCHAAALPETWFTVWANLVQMGRLAKGERLLIHGGSSGIGLTAIQLARYLGAECFATVGSEEKAEFCRRFGSHHVINYRTNNFASEIKHLTSNQGVDVILDMVGAPYLQRNLSLLRRDGRLLYIAFLEGSKGEADLMPVMLKRLTITGSTMRPRTRSEKAAIRDALSAQIWPELDAGRLQPHIHAVFPLDQAADAHRLMESSRHIGKIILKVALG